MKLVNVHKQFVFNMLAFVIFEYIYFILKFPTINIIINKIISLIRKCIYF